MTAISIREYLVTRRHAVGWSQEELAEHSTLSVRTIRNLETGSITNPRRASVNLLLKAFQTVDTTLVRPPDVVVLSPQDDPDALVGRAADLVYLRNALRRNRCLLIHGPAGAGKSKLALRAAADAQSDFPDGLAVVDAGTLPPEGDDVDASLKHVRRAVHTAVLTSSRHPDPAPVSASTSHPVAADRRLLLLIDNAEHVMRSVSLVAEELLADHAGLTLIITSRRAMPLPRAAVWEVGPLPARSHFGDADGPEAVELFLLRAAEVCPTLDLRNRHDEIAELCAKLDGMPLAIELAALRLRTLSLGTLLRTDTLSVLSGTRPEGLPHQRTLAGSLRWSYDLLRPEQRSLLHRLARSTNPFTLDAIERVLQEDGIPVLDLADRLSELVEASLVQVVRGADYSYRLFGYARDYVNALGGR